MNYPEGGLIVEKCRPSSFLIAFGIALLGMFIKAPDAITNAQFWAEDGTVFFAQQFGHHWPQLLTPYAGYLHTVPRLVAWFANLFPYSQAPLFYNISALLIDSWAIAYFSLKTSSVIPSWVSLVGIMLIPSNGEILGSLVNVQWFLQLVLFSATLLPKNHRKSSITARASYLFLVFLISLTGPFSILCVILTVSLTSFYTLAKYLKSSTGKTIETWWNNIDKPVSLVVAIGAIVQLSVLATIGHRSNFGPFSIDVAEKLFTAGIESHILGLNIIPKKYFWLILLLLAFTFYQVLFRNNPKWLLILIMLVFASSQILPFAYVGNDPFISTDSFRGDRYFFFMKVSLLLSATSLLLEYSLIRKLRLYTLPMLSLIMLIIFHPDLGRRRELTELHWKDKVANLKPSASSIELPINPVPWKIILRSPGNPDKKP